MAAASRSPSPVALIVLDGWGWRREVEGNAIAMASTPVWDKLMATSPATLLDASGLAVGLPEGQMGNSEVGHLNLGAGRVVPQDLVRINKSIAAGEFAALPALAHVAGHAVQSGGTVHLIGLLGPGGVHAMDTHLLATIDAMIRLGAPRIAIHGFLDGRDTPPRSAADVVARLIGDIARHGAGRTVLASLTGRYYAMDRDKRWERTRLAYDAMVHGTGTRITDPVAAIRAGYDRDETDEFVHPLVIEAEGEPVATMRDGDAIFCFNYRSDRMRQILAALALPQFDGFDISDRPELFAATMTQYDQTFPFELAFPPFSMVHILAEILSGAARRQFRAAETEKYPHVTYFFNGGNEPPWPGEERSLVPSPKVATYDLQPSMSAAGVTDVFCGAIGRGEYDFLLANFANADMVGHTGVFPAVIEAVEIVDRCLGRILHDAREHGVQVLVTADHGNAEMMIDPVTGGPHTAHTTSPVPLALFGTPVHALRSGGALCDVAPTVLALLGLQQPDEMTGKPLMAG
ncbi:MAG: 2,3-bisphosphoglycerate-independent phosphoglycerate mutase [Gemmatimonadales bacterium]